MNFKLSLALVVSCAAVASTAAAESPTTTAPAEKHEYGPKPFHYSLPWQLRPAITWNVVRSDTSYSFFEGKAPLTGETLKGNALVTSLLFGYKVTEEIQPFVRMAFTSNSPPVGDKATALSNPVVGVTYGLKPTDDIRVAAILALTAPIGQGGGDTPSPATNAQQNANFARSAMDGALFAVNDLAIIPGVSAAYIAHGLTVQGELTYVQLTRTRGQGDKSRSVLTSGIHVGYFLIPQLSIGGELRHQRFLSTPLAVERIPALREISTFALGVRGHFHLGDRLWLRPGVSFTMPLDQPLSDAKLKVVQLDIPFVF